MIKTLINQKNSNLKYALHQIKEQQNTGKKTY
jgi:hypothetical protein